MNKTNLILIGTFLVVLLLWNTPLVYPVKIFVVCLHELAHALAAILTGGQVAGIQIFANQGGVALTRGGIRFVILSAGYLGSVLAGGFLLYLSSHRRWGRELMTALAVLMVLATLLFFRNLFGIVYGLLSAAAMAFSASRFSDTVNQAILRFIAITSSLYALLDIRSDLFRPDEPALAASGVVNDAVALARLTGIPAIVWAVMWIAVSAAALIFFLRLASGVRDEGSL
ncbi:MAG: M50 family metallopeptidase [Thermoflexales bacterium]|nr:M50 family metallopeptidase [Thermoflexales bacterium]